MKDGSYNCVLVAHNTLMKKMRKPDLKKNLRQFRQEHVYDGSGMAMLLDLSIPEYKKLEHGESKASDSEMIRILSILCSDPGPFSNLNKDTKPMAIASFLKRRLLYGSISTLAALTYFRIVAEKLESDAAVQWVRYETYGNWPDIEEAPLYRIFQPSYDIEYEQNGIINYMSLPADFVSSINDEGYFLINDSIDQVDEYWISRGTIIPISEVPRQDLEHTLQSVYGSDFKLLGVAGRVPNEFDQKILLAVQEIILGLIMSLETHLDSDSSLEEVKVHKHLADLLLSEILDRVGSADHLDLPLKPVPWKEITLIEGDEDTFCDWLEEHGISFYELDGFLSLCEKFDDSPPPKGIVPPEIYEWASKVNSSNWQFREDKEKLINGLKIFYGV